jgi:hypothetical protein
MKREFIKRVIDLFRKRNEQKKKLHHFVVLSACFEVEKNIAELRK